MVVRSLSQFSQSLRPSGTNTEINYLKQTTKDNLENPRQDLTPGILGSGLVPSFYCFCEVEQVPSSSTCNPLGMIPPVSQFLNREELCTLRHFTKARAVKQGNSPRKCWSPTVCWAVPGTRAPAVSKSNHALALWRRQSPGSHRYTIQRSFQPGGSMTLGAEDKDTQSHFEQGNQGRPLRGDK